jgi:hypothetical protein
MTGAAAAVAAAYAAIVSIAVRSASSSSLIAVEGGPVLTLAGAITMAVGALLTALLTAFTRARRADRVPNRQ